MKRAFGLALLFSITSFIVSAQISIKPSAGVNFTDFSKNPSTGKFKAKTGYQVGGSVLIGQKVYIEPGLYYVRKSTEYSTDDTNPNTVDYNISGIRIPVSIGAHFVGNNKSPVAVRGFAGASAFILTRIEDLDKDDFETANWGVFAGLGVDFSMVFVEAKYEWSLTNIQKDVTLVDVGKSRSIFLNAGVRLPL